MCNFYTKVNALKIRFLYFKINLIFFYQTSVKGEQGKTNLITLLTVRLSACLTAKTGSPRLNFRAGKSVSNKLN
jgi:hypothetical protein